MAEQKLRGAAAATAKPASARPLATAAGGYDYFVSEAHYASLAKRILASLQRGCRIIVATGDPKPNPPVLSAALTHAASGQYEVVTISSAPGYSGDRLRNVSGRPLFVFEEADRLTDAQLAELYDFFIPADCVTAAGVLVAAPELSTRLGRLKASTFDEMRVAYLKLHELGREEIESFIRRQLPPGEEVSGLTAEAIDGIADFSGGDPAQVARLARLMLDFPHGAGNNEQMQPARVVAELPSSPPPRRRLAWAAAIGLLLCATVGVVIQIGLGRYSSEIATEGSATAEAAARPEAPSEPVSAEVAQAALETAPAGQAEREAAAPAEETAIREAPATAPDPPNPAAPAAQSTPAPEPRLSAEEAAALVARGDFFMQMRDIASARLFYERAAGAGYGRAALRMAETFDPAFLGRAGIAGLQGDPQHALFWYRYSRDLGDPDAARLLERSGSEGQPQPAK